jgi:AcrR family transcriptional regulator
MRRYHIRWRRKIIGACGLDVRFRTSAALRPERKIPPIPRSSKPDRRVDRTRQSLLVAFRDLILECGYDRLTVRDVIEHANVGRSTFYEHFENIEDLFEQSIAPLLAILADALEANPDRKRLQMVVAHFWANRRVSRIFMAEPTRPLMSRLLAKLIEERLSKRARNSRGKKPAIPIGLIAAHLAEAQLGLVSAWLSETAACDAGALADALHASTNSAASALL